MGGLVTLLLLLHCYFVSTGQTTYEFLKSAWKKRPNSSFIRPNINP